MNDLYDDDDATALESSQTFYHTFMIQLTENNVDIDSQLNNNSLSRTTIQHDDELVVNKFLYYILHIPQHKFQST